jgi:hypothetical protein
MATAAHLATSIAAGAHVVITASALATLGEFALPMLGVTTATGWLCRRFLPGTQIKTQTSAVIEAASFSLCPFATGGDFRVQILATEPSTNTSAAFTIWNTSQPTAGSLTVLLADQFATAPHPAGASSSSFTCPRPGMNFTDFEPDRPHVMLAHARLILSGMMAARSLFSVDGSPSMHSSGSSAEATSDLAAERNQLSWLVLGSSPAYNSSMHNATTEYLVAISNPNWNVQPFAIRPGPALGSVQTADLNVTEIYVDESERKQPNFAPPGIVAENATDPSKGISGGSIRVFKIAVRSASSAQGPTVLPPLLPSSANAPKRRWLRLGVDATRPNLMAAIIGRPSFSLHFDGVILDWHYILERDDIYLLNDAKFAAARRLRLAVDMTSAMAPFPHWRLCNDSSKTDSFDVADSEYQRSVAQMSELLRKMAILNASDLLTSLHGAGNSKTCEASTVQRLGSFGREAQAAGVRVHIRLSGKSGASNILKDLVEYVRSTGVDAKWLKVAPSLALLLDDNRKSTVAALQQLVLENGEHGEGGMLFLLATTGVDETAVKTTEHRSIASLLSPTATNTFNASAAAKARQLLHLIGGTSLVFDAAFLSHDEELLDVACTVHLLEEG